MKGAIIGDIVGSVYEFHTIKGKQFKFFKPKCFYTDDTVLTCAIANASLAYKDFQSMAFFKDVAQKEMQKLGQQYPDVGYGHAFHDWLQSDNPEPYNSYGNGAAMRTSSVAYVANSLEEAEQLATIQAELTHSHPEGIKGAKAISACIFMALHGNNKEEIKEYIEENYYPLDFTIRQIYRKYKYDITAQGSVPQAIESFLEGNNFEDCVRNAICLGGDADTLAAMTGSIAEAYYGIPKEYEQKIGVYLDDNLNSVVETFYNKIQTNKNRKFSNSNKK